MESIEVLEDRARAANRALHKAQGAQRDLDNSELIGKCFKYHNSGGGCGAKWWYYVKVLRTKDGYLKCFSFQSLPNGEIQIATDSYKMTTTLKNGGYIPITSAKFNAAWKKLSTKIKRMPL